MDAHQQAMLARCAPGVSASLMHAIVQTESAWNQLAIGLDAGQGPAVRQPVHLGEAVAAAEALHRAGRRFSVGLAQIHVSHLEARRLSWHQAFEPCRNLALGQTVLWQFHRRAQASGYTGAAAWRAALRGYNSGALRSQAAERYADRVLAAVDRRTRPTAPGTAGVQVQWPLLERSTHAVLDVFEKRGRAVAPTK